MITIKMELDFSDLQKQTWCCDDVLETISNHNLEDEFMAHLEEIYFMNDSELPTMTELNDYIRFESDSIFECLGLNEDGNEVDKDEE